MRIGMGYDLHRLGPKRDLVIGGVTIPHDLGCIAHSDGDVLIHAIIDALFGALALGDIGDHFPPSDPQWKDINSQILLKEAVSLIKRKGFQVSNIDTTTILEKPKLYPFKNLIRKNLSSILNIGLDQVSFKAKTKEGVDSTGRNESVESYAVVLLERIEN